MDKVRTYQRKTNWGQDNEWLLLLEAHAEMSSGQLKASVASHAYSIPETTLHRYLKLSSESILVNDGRFQGDTIERV